jgi:hypothetical protein
MCDSVPIADWEGPKDTDNVIQNYLSCISYVYRHVQNYAELLHVETVLSERFIGLHAPQRSQVYRFLLLS